MTIHVPFGRLSDCQIDGILLDSSLEGITIKVYCFILLLVMDSKHSRATFVAGNTILQESIH